MGQPRKGHPAPGAGNERSWGDGRTDRPPGSAEGPVGLAWGRSNPTGGCGAATVRPSVPAPHGCPCGARHRAMAPSSEGVGTPGWAHQCLPPMHPLVPPVNAPSLQCTPLTHPPSNEPLQCTLSPTYAAIAPFLQCTLLTLSPRLDAPSVPCTPIMLPPPTNPFDASSLHSPLMHPLSSEPR